MSSTYLAERKKLLFHDMVFHLIPGQTKRKLTRVIQQHGGQITSRRVLKHYICLADERLWSSSFRTESDCYWPTYVIDCINKGTLLDIEPYKCKAGTKKMRRIPDNLLGDDNSDNASEDNFDEESPFTKVFIRARGMGRMKYHLAEDLKILKYLVENRAFKRAKGNSLWSTMEMLQITPHSAQSMKSRFKDIILKQLDEYNIPDNWKAYFTGMSDNTGTGLDNDDDDASNSGADDVHTEIDRQNESDAVDEDSFAVVEGGDVDDFDKYLLEMSNKPAAGQPTNALAQHSHHLPSKLSVASSIHSPQKKRHIEKGITLRQIGRAMIVEIESGNSSEDEPTMLTRSPSKMSDKEKQDGTSLPSTNGQRGRPRIVKVGGAKEKSDVLQSPSKRSLTSNDESDKEKQDGASLPSPKRLRGSPRKEKVDRAKDRIDIEQSAAKMSVTSGDNANDPEKLNCDVESPGGKQRKDNSPPQKKKSGVSPPRIRQSTRIAEKVHSKTREISLARKTKSNGGYLLRRRLNKEVESTGTVKTIDAPVDSGQQKSRDERHFIDPVMSLLTLQQRTQTESEAEDDVDEQERIQRVGGERVQEDEPVPSTSTASVLSSRRNRAKSVDSATTEEEIIPSTSVATTKMLSRRRRTKSIESDTAFLAQSASNTRSDISSTFLPVVVLHPLREGSRERRKKTEGVDSDQEDIASTRRERSSALDADAGPKVASPETFTSAQDDIESREQGRAAPCSKTTANTVRQNEKAEARPSTSRHEDKVCREMTVLGVIRALSTEFDLTLKEARTLLWRHSGDIKAMRIWIITGHCLPGHYYWQPSEDQVLLHKSPDQPEWQHLERRYGTTPVLNRLHWLLSNK